MADTKQGTTITMPKLGESVTEGTIAGWLKKVGDRVDRYDPMVEVVTDKVNAEVPAPVAGTLIEILTGEGDVVPVGEAICIIDTGAGTIETTVDVPEADDSATDRTVVMSAAPMAEMEASDEMIYDAPSESPDQDRSSNGSERDVDAEIAQARSDRDERAMLQIRSSPLVRRLASEHDVDLASVTGTGIGGRVTKSDIEAYLAQPEPADTDELAQQPAPQPARQPSTPPQVEVWPGDEVHEASTMRKQIAEHMVRSVSTAPHVTVWMEVDMSAIVNYREELKADFREREGFSLTYVPLVLSSVVGALQEYPEINAVWDNGRIIRRKAINIGLAVALDDGLIVPVLKHADEKNITGLARAVNDLVERARDSKLTPDDVSGGTFTLNNPGTLGSISSTPLLVQPQAGILSMEAIVKRPVVIDDMIGIRPMMNLSMSVDHRLLDGLSATRFLSNVKYRLEHFQAG